MFTLVYLLVACTIAPILNGLAISTLWGWFVVPVFYLPALNIPFAIGLGLLISYMTNTANFYKDMEPEIGKYFSYLFIKPAAAIIFGFIVKQFI